MRFNTTLRDFLVCLSFANLIMMKVWLMLLPYEAGKSFILAHSPYNSYLSAMIITTLIGLVLWCVSLIANRWDSSAKVLWPFIHGVTLFFALNGIRCNFGWGLHPLYRVLGKSGVQMAGISAILLMIGLVFWLVRYWDMVASQNYRVALVLLPFVIVTFGQSAMALRQAEPERAFAPHAYQNIQNIQNTLEMPVVWIIFDELDYGIGFGRRPKDLLLPEFDKLQQTSSFVTHAFSPSDRTMFSIPSLLTGNTLKITKPLSSAEMILTKTDGTTSNMHTESTIFDDMHNRGGKTALFGWAFPYSRLFNNVNVIKDYLSLSHSSVHLASIVVMQLRSLVEWGYFSPFGDSLAVKDHISIITSMQKDVIHYLQTNQCGFVFLHYPVPHSMNIYNRYTHKFGPNRNVKEGYLDNVALVDLLLGEIRCTMEKTVTWDKALIIVSSDHHLRVNDYDGIIEKRRVPFIVKLPNQESGIVVSDRFETVNTRQLILNVVDGKIKTPEELKSWMQELITH